ncbi:hypothetical protein FLAT13_01611 [Flavobacterium salmonis]|uniref:Xaa-Pro aminopeptidase n=1 Tax=Flavobacterium salmonis TaxID=2654844 RepID=A0A6V6YV86_9FLAO|nr:hypothetical protein FLAT13_01611 [Flavobacterium salmonis]
MLDKQNDTTKQKHYGSYGYTHSHNNNKKKNEAELRGIKPLEIKNEATKMLTLGTLWKQYHAEISKIMTSELLGLGLIDKADVQNENPDWPAYKKYFMRGTSHHMGLDTHDYGLLHEPMKANMVFTVEPGIYIPSEKFGIRLEDNVVVQEKGEPFNLMRNIPVEVDEIETLMNA